MLSKRFLLVVAIILGVHGTRAVAQAPRPAAPKEYDVELRYRIQAGRNDRLKQYFAFVKALEAAGFQKDQGPDDEPDNPTYNRMSGKIASNKVRELFRSPAVKSLLIYPAGYQLPEDGDTPVKVSLELSSGRAAEQQRLFADQVREQLKDLGFREILVYDHRGYSRLVGTLPASEVPSLFHDLRTQPSGWLVPARPAKELPAPLRDALAAVRIAEVTPEPEGTAPAKELPEEAPLPAVRRDAATVKLSDELRSLLANAEEMKKARRIELLLLQAPREGEEWSQPLLRAAPQAAIEGRVGASVTAYASPEQALALAGHSSVIAVRLPRSGTPVRLPLGDAKDANTTALKSAGLTALHAQGHRGKGVRVAVIGGDFRGYEALVGKQLPKDTRLLDLTAERNSQLLPEAYPKDEETRGAGTESALVVALAAPEASLLLIRVDPAAPYQLMNIMRAINGETPRSESLEARREDLETFRQITASKWDMLLKERRVLFDSPGSADEFDDDAIKRKQRREAHKEDVAKLEEEEKAYRQALGRYVKLFEDLRDLRRVQVVVSTLLWTDGQPMDGSSPLSRYLDDKPFRSTLWFQPAGDTRDQAWVGLFHDADGNGVMEFAAPETALKPERWTPEVNFLAWQPFAGAKQLKLPEKTKLRVSVQWREAHDAAFLRAGEDAYQTPLATMRLVLLRQRDPSGKALPADEMEIVARAVSTPLRIANADDASTYEQVLEFTTESAGRYALRIEGKAPTGTRPLGAPALAGAVRVGELRPRVFVDVVDAVNRAAGRAVFHDYATDEGTIALPGMAQRSIPVGSASANDRPRPTSAPGPAYNLALLPKPDALAYDGLPVAAEGKAVFGTPAAAALAAGRAAVLIGKTKTNEMGGAPAK